MIDGYLRRMQRKAARFEGGFSLWRYIRARAKRAKKRVKPRGGGL